jgi:hypothetical protein
MILVVVLATNTGLMFRYIFPEKKNIHDKQKKKKKNENNLCVADENLGCQFEWLLFLNLCVYVCMYIYIPMSCTKFWSSHCENH